MKPKNVIPGGPRPARPHLLAAAAIAGGLTLSLAGCATPDAVARFSSAAVATLTSATPVFEDMKQSCLREVNSRQKLGTFRLPSEDSAGCNELGAQAEGAKAAALVVAEYFGAINSLASFGTAKAGGDAGDLVTRTSAAVGAGSPAQTALGSLAKVLVSAATAGYQTKSLEKDLTKVSGNVPPVVDALVKIIRDDYVGRVLAEEEKKLATRYRELAQVPGATAEVLLLLDDRWRADEKALQAKRASAQSLTVALESMSKGFSALAASSHQLNAKEVPGLLGPYVTQIQTLIPQIQSAF